MRRLLATGFGFGLALSSGFAEAQTPAGGPNRSAVRLVGVRSSDQPLLLARAQAAAPGTPVPMPMPMPGTNTPKPMGSPMSAAPPSSSGSPTPLGMPTPFGSGPNISEYPGSPYPTPGYSSGPQGVTLGPPTANTLDPSFAYGYPQVMAPEAYANHGAFPQLDAPLFEGCHSQPAFGQYGYEGGYDPGYTLPGYSAPGFAGILGTYGPYRGANRWSLSAEYLLWFTKSAQFPALLSTSSPAFNGILGTGDSRVIFGNGSFGDTLHSGGRFGFSRRIGGADLWSLDGNIFVLNNNGNEFRTDSSQFPVLARPFFNVNQGIPFVEVLTSPGLSVGSAAVKFENMVWGGEFNLRRRLVCNPCSRLDLIGGFRYLNVSEELGITESFTRTPNSPTSIGVPNAMAGTVVDNFRTENHFYGGTVGLAYERRRGRWFTSLTGKVSLGQVEQQVSINGGQTIMFDNGTIGQYAGGLLAVPGANIGTYSQRRFAVVPEIGFNIGMQLTRHCRAFVGYNFLYINSIVRPGDQIDQNIDITRIPNFPVTDVTRLSIPRPGVPLKDVGFFAQGVSFGFQWSW